MMNNAMEHQATVDKGLKMKIKRKNIAGSKTETKHEIIKGDYKVTTSSVSTVTSCSGGTMSGGCIDAKSMGSPPPPSGALDKLKQALLDKEGKDKVNKGGPGRGAYNKRGAKDKGPAPSPATKTEPVSPGAYGLGSPNSGHTLTNINMVNTSTGVHTGGANAAIVAGNVTVELDRISTPVTTIKKEQPFPDPYEFNAGVEDQVEDRIALPVKKIKTEKIEAACSPIASEAMETTPGEQRDMATDTHNIAVATDPDCLGPCEPGSSVVLEGIVWNETPSGILVVNVTWRGKTYVGTLMDATRHDWAPPRFSCDSPACAEPEVRTPRGRGKRGRAAATPPVMEPPLGERRLRKRRNNNNPYNAPPSPAKSEATKRKVRNVDADYVPDQEGPKPAKRSRNSLRGGVAHTLVVMEGGFIECPDANCSKKYRHINGLRYHQTHAHKNPNFSATLVDEESMDVDSKQDVKAAAEDVESKETKVPPSPNGKVGRKRANAFESSSEPQDCKEASAPIPGKGRKGIKKEDKQKAEKLDKQPTVALTHVNLDKNSPIKSIPPSVTSDSMGPPSTNDTTSSSAINSLSVSIPTTVSQAAKDTKPENDKVGKKSKSEKNKHKDKSSKMVASPPGAMGPPVATSLSSVTTHPHVSVSAGSGTTPLKPIQPKPTVLGEANAVNPTLAASLKEMKEKKPKKKKVPTATLR